MIVGVESQPRLGPQGQVSLLGWRTWTGEGKSHMGPWLSHGTQFRELRAGGEKDLDRQSRMVESRGSRSNPDSHLHTS